MTEASIDAGLTRDLYVSLGEPVERAARWIVRVYVKPFVDWIWGGCLVMALGGLLAATDRRYRAPRAASARRRPAFGPGRRHEAARVPDPAGGIPRARGPSSSIGLGRDPREVPSPLIDKPAPKFALSRLDDAHKIVKLDDLRGKAFILNVWASWCVACREEHPRASWSSRRSAPCRSTASTTRTRAPTPMPGWPASAIPTTRRSSTRTAVGIDFGVYGVPETFVIDGNGVIRMKHIGPLTPEVLATKIEPLLKKLDA